MVQSTRLVTDEHGLIPLARYENCTENYNGQFTGASVFVVGRGTTKERIFRRAQKDEAIRYAQREGEGKGLLTIDHIHSTSLCARAMLQLLGA